MVECTGLWKHANDNAEKAGQFRPALPYIVVRVCLSTRQMSRAPQRHDGTGPSARRLHLDVRPLRSLPSFEVHALEILVDALQARSVFQSIVDKTRRTIAESQPEPRGMNDE